MEYDNRDKAKEIGMAIKNARDKLGWTQGKLADLLGVTDKAVSAWENGHNTPTLNAANKLIAVVGVDPAVFIDADMGQSAISDLQQLNEVTDPGTIMSKRAQDVAKAARNAALTKELSQDTVPPDEWLRPNRPEAQVIYNPKELKPIESYVLTEQEIRLISYYRKLDAAGKSALMTMVERL